MNPEQRQLRQAIPGRPFGKKRLSSTGNHVNHTALLPPLYRADGVRSQEPARDLLPGTRRKSVVLDSSATLVIARLQQQIDEQRASLANSQRTIKALYTAFHTEGQHAAEVLSILQDLCKQVGRLGAPVSTGSHTAVAAPADQTKEGETAQQLQETIRHLEAQNRSLLSDLQELREKNTAASTHQDTTDTDMERLTTRIADLERALTEEQRLRRQYLERFCSLRGKFRTAVRIKPGAAEGTFRIEGRQLHISQQRTSALAKLVTETKSFELDNIIGPVDSDDTVWEEVAPLFESVRDGAPAAVLFYGRTGTGKSYNADLILQRIGQAIFPKPGAEASIVCLEVYQDQLRDLLPAAKPTRQDAQPLPLAVPSAGLVHPLAVGAASTVVTTTDELLQAVTAARRRRRTKSTRCNDQSSRSHAVTTISFAGGSITLLDLAGHERHLDSGADVVESAGINSALGTLTTALARMRDHQHRQKRSGPCPRLKPGDPAHAIWMGSTVTRILGAVLYSDANHGRANRSPLGAKLMVLSTVDLCDPLGTTATIETLKFTTSLI